MLYWGKFLGNCFDCLFLSWGDETRSKAVPYYFSFCVCLYLWETKLKQSLCLTCLLVFCLFLFLSLWTDKTKSNAVSHFFLIFLFPPYFSPVFLLVFLVCLSPCFSMFSLFVCLSPGEPKQDFHFSFSCSAIKQHLGTCFSSPFFFFLLGFLLVFSSKIKDGVPLFRLLFCITKQHLGTLPDPLLSRPFLLRSYFSNTESCKHKIRFSHSLLRKLWHKFSNLSQPKLPKYPTSSTTHLTSAKIIPHHTYSVRVTAS